MYRHARRAAALTVTAVVAASIGAAPASAARFSVKPSVEHAGPGANWKKNKSTRATASMIRRKI